MAFGSQINITNIKHLVIILRRPTGYWKKRINKQRCVGLLIGCWLYLRLRVRLYSNGSIGVHWSRCPPANIRSHRLSVSESPARPSACDIFRPHVKELVKSRVFLNATSSNLLLLWLFWLNISCSHWTGELSISMTAITGMQLLKILVANDGPQKTHDKSLIVNVSWPEWATRPTFSQPYEAGCGDSSACCSATRTGEPNAPVWGHTSSSSPHFRGF